MRGLHLCSSPAWPAGGALREMGRGSSTSGEVESKVDSGFKSFYSMVLEVQVNFTIGVESKFDSGFKSFYSMVLEVQVNFTIGVESKFDSGFKSFYSMVLEVQVNFTIGGKVQNKKTIKIRESLPE